MLTSENIQKLPNAQHGMEERPILCLATQAWNEHWSLSQQVMLRVARDWKSKVVYVEPYHPPLAWFKKKHSVLRKEHSTPYLRNITDNLLIYRPRFPYLPGNLKWQAAARANGPLYRAEIRFLLSKLGLQDPLLWAFFAQNTSILDLSFSYLVYDCVDDWPSFFPDPREQRYVAEVDEILCRRADLVFAGSEPLADKKLSLNRKTFVVNHAADIPHFNTACNRETIVPDDLESIPHPRIGFVGMIDSVRFDPTIIESIAANPGLQVVVIGGFLGNTEKSLSSRPNIHKLGMKNVSQLPAYLKGLDVCIMPYRLNEATRNIFPLKLYEYLATGKPVVATPIPAVVGLEPMVYIAEDAQAFSRVVDYALRESGESLAIKRREHASHHTWEAHVDKKCQLILRHLLQS